MAKRQMQIRATQTGQVSKKAQGEPCFLESSWDDNAVEQTCQKAVASCLDLRLVTGHCYGLVQGREGEGNRCVDQCTGMGEFYSRAHLRLRLHNLAGASWTSSFGQGLSPTWHNDTTTPPTCTTTISRRIYATHIHVTLQASTCAGPLIKTGIWNDLVLCAWT